MINTRNMLIGTVAALIVSVAIIVNDQLSEVNAQTLRMNQMNPTMNTLSTMPGMSGMGGMGGMGGMIGGGMMGGMHGMGGGWTGETTVTVDLSGMGTVYDYESIHAHLFTSENVPMDHSGQ